MPAAKSNAIPLPFIRAALTLRKVSIPKIAAKHGASYATCYAILGGTRPGKTKRTAKARKAVTEMQQIAAEVLGDV